MEYLRVMMLSMLPVIELRGAIPIGIAMGLDTISVYICSVIGSTMVSIPLILTYREIVKFLKSKNIFTKILDKIDRKIRRGMKKMKAISILGIILFVGIPLPTTGTWTASAIASILRMRTREAFLGVFLGNCMSGIIVLLISMHII